MGAGEGGRKVAREVDIDNYTTVDQIGDIEVSKEEQAEKAAREAKLEEMTEADREQFKEKERKLKDRLLKEEEKLNVDLDKIVIKKLETKPDDKSMDEKVLVVKTPNNLIAKLAEKRKELAKKIIDPEPKSDQEKADVRKKFKEKYQSEERITEKILNMALESVFYDGEHGEELINKLLEEDNTAEEEKHEEVHREPAPPPPIPVMDEHDTLDFEAENEEPMEDEGREGSAGPVEENEENVEYNEEQVEEEEPVVENEEVDCNTETTEAEGSEDQVQ